MNQLKLDRRREGGAGPGTTQCQTTLAPRRRGLARTTLFFLLRASSMTRPLSAHGVPGTQRGGPRGPKAKPTEHPLRYRESVDFSTSVQATGSVFLVPRPLFCFDFRTLYKPFEMQRRDARSKAVYNVATGSGSPRPRCTCTMQPYCRRQHRRTAYSRSTCSSVSTREGTAVAKAQSIRAESSCSGRRRDAGRCRGRC